MSMAFKGRLERLSRLILHSPIFQSSFSVQTRLQYISHLDIALVNNGYNLIRFLRRYTFIDVVDKRDPAQCFIEQTMPL